MAPVDLLIGPMIQCLEAATLGMPFEVWKTRMGSNRTEGTLEAFKNIYRKGGPKAFWAGTGPKMFESASKVRRVPRRKRASAFRRAATLSSFPIPNGKTKAFFFLFVSDAPAFTETRASARIERRA